MRTVNGNRAPKKRQIKQKTYTKLDKLKYRCINNQIQCKCLNIVKQISETEEKTHGQLLTGVHIIYKDQTS